MQANHLNYNPLCQYGIDWSTETVVIGSAPFAEPLIKSPIVSNLSKGAKSLLSYFLGAVNWYKRTTIFKSYRELKEYLSMSRYGLDKAITELDTLGIMSRRAMSYKNKSHWTVHICQLVQSGIKTTNQFLNTVFQVSANSYNNIDNGSKNKVKKKLINIGEVFNWEYVQLHNKCIDFNHSKTVRNDYMMNKMNDINNAANELDECKKYEDAVKQWYDRVIKDMGECCMFLKDFRTFEEGKAYAGGIYKRSQFNHPFNKSPHYPQHPEEYAQYLIDRTKLGQSSASQSPATPKPSFNFYKNNATIAPMAAATHNNYKGGPWTSGDVAIEREESKNAPVSAIEMKIRERAKMFSEAAKAEGITNQEFFHRDMVGKAGKLGLEL